MALKENKRKYDEEEEVSTVTSKKRWAFGDYNDDDGGGLFRGGTHPVTPLRRR
jgi:hypothetical protein